MIHPISYLVANMCELHRESKYRKHSKMYIVTGNQLKADKIMWNVLFLLNMMCIPMLLTILLWIAFIFIYKLCNLMDLFYILLLLN